MFLAGFSSLLAEWQHEGCIGGMAWRLPGMAQDSRQRAQLLGCSWTNHLRVSLRPSSQAEGKGQSTQGAACFSLMSPLLSTGCHGGTSSLTLPVTSCLLTSTSRLACRPLPEETGMESLGSPTEDENTSCKYQLAVRVQASSLGVSIKIPMWEMKPAEI